MIEQSILHGQMYFSVIRNNTLLSKAVNLSNVKFGPMRHITIYLEGEYVGVKNNTTNEFMLYKDGKKQGSYPSVITTTKGYSYYYGMAEYIDKHEIQLYPYYLQNIPEVTITTIPDIEIFEIPRTLQALDYDCVFTYPDIIYTLIGDIQASYVDKFKRPIIQRQGRTYPIDIDTAQTTFKDLQPTTYPIAVQFANTPFAMVDLEPGYTATDLAHFNSLEGYYVEDTIRGGKHLLVPSSTDIYKCRYSEKLEIINASQVTLYGINGKALHKTPKEIDWSIYDQVMRNKQVLNIAAQPIDKDLIPYVNLLKQKSIDNISTSILKVKQVLEMDTNTSHAEYMALYILYKTDIEQYKSQLPIELLPWIIEAYARDVIPWREKHETMRKGVPYLVYLANIIIQYKKKE